MDHLYGSWSDSAVFLLPRLEQLFLLVEGHVTSTNCNDVYIVHVPLFIHRNVPSRLFYKLCAKCTNFILAINRSAPPSPPGRMADQVQDSIKERNSTGIPLAVFTTPSDCYSERFSALNCFWQADPKRRFAKKGTHKQARCNVGSGWRLSGDNRGGDGEEPEITFLFAIPD